MHIAPPPRATLRSCRRHGSFGCFAARLYLSEATIKSLPGVRVAAALDTARQPFRSGTWMAALSVIAGPGRRRLRPDPAAGRGPVRAGGAARGHPPRRAEALPADRARAVHRARRSGRGDRAPARRAGTRAAGADGLAAHPGPAGRDRAADDRRPGRARADRRWSPRSPACPRSARRRSWPRPATRGGSPPAGRWSSTPAWRRGRNCPARSPAGPS